MKISIMYLLLATSVLFTGCDVVNPPAALAGDSPSSLIGVYAFEQDGGLEEFVRLEHRNGEYLMFLKENGRWGDAEKVTPVDKAGLEAILKESVSVSFVGLGNDNIALFKMPRGWKTGDFETKTGYWLATMLGPLELQKQ